MDQKMLDAIRLVGPWLKALSKQQLSEDEVATPLSDIREASLPHAIVSINVINPFGSVEELCRVADSMGEVLMSYAVELDKVIFNRGAGAVLNAIASEDAANDLVLLPCYN
jgi:hypothetical protein